jgi:Tol biopolymer transport system component
MGRKTRWLGAAATALMLAVLAGCNPSVVSINHQGTNAGDDNSTDPVVSPDGTKVAFLSRAHDLVPGMPNDVYVNVYVRDLVAGTTELVSVSNGGAPGDLDSTYPVFSPDGTKIAFGSQARNLTPQSVGGHHQLYLRDLVADTTEMISVDATGTGPGDGESWSPSFSPDGTKVAFDTRAGNLGPTDTNNWTDVYVRDLVTDTSTLLSRNAAGTDAAIQGGYSPVFSPDGGAVAYSSTATDLGPLDTNRSQDAYLTDLATGTTTLLSQNAAGTDSANDPSDLLGFSPDGQLALFKSYATDLVAGTPVDFYWDYFLRDLTTGTTTRIDVVGFEVTERSFTFSPDGTQLAFATDSGSLDPRDTVVCHSDNIPPRPYACVDVYLHDLATGATTLVSTNAAGTSGGNGDSGGPHFSPDGERLVFSSTASDLGPTDTNEFSDVYVADLATGDVTLVSSREDGTDSGSYPSQQGVFGQDERTVVFTSMANDLGPGPDTNGHTDIYLKVLPED